MGLLLWLLAIVLWLTWTPLSLRPPRIELLPRAGVPVVVGNLALLAPIAAILAAFAAPQGGARRALWLAGGTAFLLSAVVEVGQLGVPGRTISVLDLALNTVGGVLAGWAAIRLRGTGVGERAQMAGVASAVFVGVLLFLCTTGATAIRGLSIYGWDPHFPVVAADEPSGRRAYRGVVERASICAGEGDERACVGPGATGERVRRLVEAARISQRVSIEARVVSETDRQRGPARILTFSPDSNVRNTTLAQEGRDLVLRVRTPLAGPNGSAVQFLLREAIRSDRPTDVRAEYTPSRVVMEANSQGRRLEAAFSIGLLNSWWLLRRLPRGGREDAVPSDLIRASVIGAAALAVPVGLACSWLIHGRLRALALAIVTTPLLVYNLERIFMRSEAEPRALGIAVLLAAAGAVLGPWGLGKGDLVGGGR